MLTLDELNQCSATAFVHNLDGIFEHSPWVAERTHASRPFESRLDLLDALRAAVAAASTAEQLALICAHPRLAARGRAAAELTAASASEQRRAGLDACTAEDLRRLDELNVEYAAKFAMPYVLAVRGHDPKSIIDNAVSRLKNTPSLEQHRALREIGLIGGFRLAERVASPAGAEVAAMCRRLARQEDARSRLREWMLAADLEVSDDGDSLVGRRPGAATHPDVSASGAAHPSGSVERSLAAGLLDSLVAIAVAQQLRQQGLRLPFDLTLKVRLSQAGLGLTVPDAAALEYAAQTLQNSWLERARAFQHGTSLHG